MTQKSIDDFIKIQKEKFAEYYKIGQLLRFKMLYFYLINNKQDTAIITEINKEEYTVTLFWLTGQRKDTYSITEALTKLEPLEKT